MRKGNVSNFDHSRVYAELPILAEKYYKSVIANDKLAMRIIEPILRHLASKGPRYNNYSGNLNRSYSAILRIGKVKYTFFTPENVAAMPKTMEGAGVNIRFRLTRKRHKIKRRRNFMLVLNKYTGRWDRVKLGLHDNYRDYKSWENVPNPNKPHRHPIPDKDIKQRSKGEGTIVIGNYTPYRRYVEYHGYRVIDANGVRRNFQNKIIDEYGKALKISFKKMCYNINKGIYQTPNEYYKAFRR